MKDISILMEIFKRLTRKKKILIITIFVIAILLIISGIVLAVVSNNEEEVSIVEEKEENAIAEVKYDLHEEESYETVTITANKEIEKIELKEMVSQGTNETETTERTEKITNDSIENTSNEEVEENNYTYTEETDWNVSEDKLVLTKDFKTNVDNSYRLTFKTGETVEVRVIITDFENVLLEVDTNGLAEGDEVVVIVNDDGTLEVISTSDPEYANKINEAKNSGKSVSIGKVSNNGVEVTTTNNIIKDIASNSNEQQANTTVIRNTTNDDTSTSNDETNNNTGIASSNKPSSSSTSSGSSSSGSSSSSSSSSSKPSGGSSSSGGSSTSSGGNPSLALTTYTVRNTSKEAEAVSVINSYFASNEMASKYGATARSATSSEISTLKASNHGTFKTLLYGQKIYQGTVIGTFVVYVEDEYTYDSAGKNAYLSDTTLYYKVF